MTDRTIDDLNMRVKIRIAPSPIHGVGVFAMRDIFKKESLYADALPIPYRVGAGSQKKLFPEILQMLSERWPTMLTGGTFFFPDTRYTAYMNHSDTPNYDAMLDLVLRDIKEGEEITEDYRRITNWEKAFPWLSTSV